MGADYPPHIERFLTRFLDFGDRPTVDKYSDLFAPGGTLFDAGMPVPIDGEAIRQAITQVLTLIPDFRFDPVRIGHNDSYVFFEAANTATLAGEPCTWTAIYAVTLSADRVRLGRRYYDRAELFRPLLAEAEDEVPAVDLDNLGFSIDRSAQNDDLSFLEYTGEIDLAGTTLPYGYIERTYRSETLRVHDTLVLKPGLAARVNEALARLVST